MRHKPKINLVNSLWHMMSRKREQIPQCLLSLIITKYTIDLQENLLIGRFVGQLYSDNGASQRQKSFQKPGWLHKGVKCVFYYHCQSQASKTLERETSLASFRLIEVMSVGILVFCHALPTPNYPHLGLRVIWHCKNATFFASRKEARLQATSMFRQAWVWLHTFQYLLGSVVSSLDTRWRSDHGKIESLPSWDLLAILQGVLQDRAEGIWKSASLSVTQQRVLC